MQLNYWDDSWPLNVDECPCDVQFLEYLQKHEIGGKVIFHFGTGEHHILGRTNHEAASPNEVLGITASRREYESYIDFIIGNPAAAVYYKVIFADIYTLTPRIIPEFDLVTMFHLCEFYDQERSAYAPLNDVSLVELFISKLKPGGRILFYKNSSHFDLAGKVIKALTDQGKLIKEDRYKTLLIYKPGALNR